MTTNAPRLTFEDFRQANRTRCLKWHPQGIGSWSPSDWMTAIVGELGELASLVKMRNRERDGLPGNKFSPSDEQIAKEAADVFTYLDLFCEAHGIDLGAAAAEKFNEVSERVGFPDRIELSTLQPLEPAGWRAALQFYADKNHFNIADDDAWDTVSGEPQNFWCDEAGTATIEDGSVAAMALSGTPLSDDEGAALRASSPAEPREPLTTEQRAKLLEAADHLSGDGHFMDAADADWAADWLRGIVTKESPDVPT